MNFARRVSWPVDNNPLTHLLGEKRKRGINILDLTETNPTHCYISSLKEYSLQPLTDKSNFNYDPDPQGMRAAREAVCAYYSRKGQAVSPDNVFLTAGTSEAYTHVFRLLAEPGDGILVPQPGYPLLHYLLQICDLKPIPYSVMYDDRGWRIDLEDLRQKAGSERPKALIIVHPNNPTGNFLQDYERKEILSLSAQLQLPVIADEVFLDYAFASTSKSLVSAAEAPVFVLSGISKILGLPQMKLSWIICRIPDAAVQKRAISKLSILADTFLSVSTPIQNALPAWLASNKATQEIQARIRENRRFLEEFYFKAVGIDVLKADAGWMSLLRMDMRWEDEKVAVSLLDRRDVLVQPGYLYDITDKPVLAVSLLVEPHVMKNGITHLAEGLSEWLSA